MNKDVELNAGFGSKGEEDYAKFTRNASFENFGTKYEMHIKSQSDVKFPLESVVYLKHRDSRNPGIVNGILYQSSGIEYRVAWPHLDGTAKWHQAIELSSEYEPNYS